MSLIKISTKLLNLNWLEAKNHRYVGQFIIDNGGLLYKCGKESIEKVIFEEYYITKINLPKNIGVKYCHEYKCVYPETIKIEDWLIDQKIIKNNNNNNKNDYNISLYPYN